VQAPLQPVGGPLGQALHVPFVHVEPVGHTLSHVPQLNSSVWRSTQLPLQLNVPPVQLSAHVPPMQSVFAVMVQSTLFAHDVPHVVGSLKLTHTPLQFVVPVGQHLPLEL
jgi:hypothetical protein